VVVRKSSLHGSIRAPPSKSHTHRTLIAALLSQGTSTIEGPLYCSDTMRTIEMCRSFGADVRERDDRVEITGPPVLKSPEHIDCGGSGTTLRIAMALAALTPGPVTLDGDASLRNRPLTDLAGALEQLGATCTTKGHRPPVTITGPIGGGTASMSGSTSSQYVSALLFACPRLASPTTLQLTSPLVSRPYVEMTRAVLTRHGVRSEEHADGFSIPAPQTYHAAHHAIEGDYSSAATLLAAGALAGDVRIASLHQDSIQGDAEIVGILRRFGAPVKHHDKTCHVVRGPLRATVIDSTHIPDLVPVCAAVATQARGTTRIINAGRLRHKESDRLETTARELSAMGADIEATDDGLDIRGPMPLHGADIETHDDHRIAMAAAVAALVADGDTIVHDVECVEKSYPNVMRDLRTLGADINEL
jgi:3-phosphoshikimate 1-carboxyvinyltransferase